MDVDAGILLIGLSQRLGGDMTTAENALRNAIWSYTCAHKTDVDGNSLEGIDLSVAKAILDGWHKKPDNWMADTIHAASEWLHGPTKDFPHHVRVAIAGTIGGDIWRLYAGTLSVLGEPTSRAWFGDAKEPYPDEVNG